jgi:hypothetical protein
MPVDASIYGAFIRPPKSAAEYEREAIDVEGARSRNALQALSLRQGQRVEEDAARTRTEQEGVRNALAGLGGGATAGARVNALRALGTQTGFAQADALEKGDLERQKTDAEVGAKRATTATSEFDLRKKRLDFTVQGMVGAGDAETVKQYLVAGVQRGDIDMATAQRMAQTIPADPAAFGAWRRDTLMGALDAKEQMRFTTPDAGQVLTAQTSVANNTANNERQAKDNAASRAVTMRGQNLTDARSRESNQAGRVPSGYRMKADGSLEFVPGGPADPAAARRAAPTEDERKAAGWLAQANNAYANMEKAISDDPRAAKPGIVESLPMVPEAAKNASRSDARQRFNQAASSFAEAALRAATGAGVNESEARQKVAELTPQWGDTPGNRQQKRDSLQVYLQSLEQRAGRAAPGVVAPSGAPVASSGFKYLGTE